MYFNLYLRSDVRIPESVKFLSEHVWFNSGSVECWEIRDCVKIEWNEHNMGFDIFFELNGEVKEFSVHNVRPDAIVAIYPQRGDEIVGMVG